MDFSECLLQRRDFKSEAIQLWPLLLGLFYLQLVQLCKCEIINPPVLPCALSLFNIIGGDPLFVPEGLMILDVGESAHEAIVEDDNLFILGEEDVDFYEIGLVDGGFDALECVLGEETGVTSVGDDLWFGFEGEFEIHLIIKCILSSRTLSNYK